MTLSYKKETELEKHVHEFLGYNFKLQVERLNTNNAKIYFLNMKDEIIFIPYKITCYNFTAGVYEVPLQIGDTECFLITWSDNYNIFFNSEKIFSLYNQKQQQEKNHKGNKKQKAEKQLNNQTTLDSFLL